MNEQELKSKISLSSTVVAASEQVSSDLGGEAVILNLKTGVYHGLNNVGARIWALIQEPKQVQAIQQTLLQEYDVEPSQCLFELLMLFQQLQAADLIEVKHETIT